MKMIHNFDDFMKWYLKGEVKPDVWSHLGDKSVGSLKNRGWKIGFFHRSRDLLAICSRSAENFEIAYRDAGIDFWVPDE